MSLGSRLSDRLDREVLNHPGRIVLVALLLTAVFATGLDDIQMSAGTEQFAEDVDAYQTNEQVTDTFQPAFETADGSTLLLQSGGNVLSKRHLLVMLTVQDRVEERSDLHVSSTRSAAQLVARELDPSASTTEDQRRVVRTASDADIRTAVRRAATDPAFQALVGDDFNARSASAAATLGVARHSVGEDELAPVQLETRRVANSAGGDVRVFGEGIVDHENKQVLKDSLQASIPAVVVLLLLFLAVSYRDPFDLVLGVVALGMALVWTFGFMGLAGIPFSQLQVALPPLLLAIGVDFGIHVINRYREEYDGDVTMAMGRAFSRLAVAFFMVTTTSVIGFAANVTSGLSPIADFGIVAASGITAMAVIFGIALPAGKILVERFREGTRLPDFDSEPLGAEGSVLGRVLPSHLAVTSKAPVLFLLVLLVMAAAAGTYGKEVDSSFEQEDMLPPETLPGYLDYLPGPMEPGSYTTTENTHFLEENFETTDDDTVTVYVDGPVYRDDALETIHRAGSDPPSTFVTDGTGQARGDSVLTVIDRYEQRSPSFAALVDRNDLNDNGVPDDNLRDVYAALLDSPYRDQTRRYLTEDYREARVVYSVEADADKGAVTDDAATVADRNRFDAVETGGTVVFQRITEEIFRSAVTSLAAALVFAAAFLLAMFYVLEGRAALGAVTLAPIVVTVLVLVATMRYLGIPFNTLTATLLSITVGVGIDYSIHVVHRFVEEFDQRGDPVVAARVTLRGTGGALFGSSMTTVSAAGALHLLSITPILVQFGILMLLSVTYSFVASVLVLPVALVAWARLNGGRDASSEGGVSA